MNEEQLNALAQLMLSKTKQVLSDVVLARGFNGTNKPVRGQFPPIAASKRASGKYIDSLTYEVDTDPEDGMPFVKIFSNLPIDEDYGVFIEQGRANGRRFPPIKEIQTWISARGIVPKPLPTRQKDGSIIPKIPTLKQLTFLISRSISEEGIFPYPFEQIVRAEIEREVVEKFEPVAAQYVNTLLRERVIFKINQQRYVR